MPVKYVGQIVEIIYLDRMGKITQRRVEVKAIRDGMMKAKCLKSGSPRIFRTENILAWKLVEKVA
ncbi:hypothetical protein G8C92_17225 [Paenibacillus donghaensis]|nr:hypothetical protein [Paenibacillus donghaensis]